MLSRIVEPLGNGKTDYGTWAMLMDTVLIRKGLKEVGMGEESPPVTGPNSPAGKAWKRKNAKARAAMILNVDISQLPHMESLSAAEVWESLRAIHQVQGFATCLSLHRQFITLQMRTDHPMSTWISDVCRVARYLKTANVSCDDEDIILVLTLGLPPSYDNFVVTLDSTPAHELTLNYVIAHLINEESRAIHKPIVFYNYPIILLEG